MNHCNEVNKNKATILNYYLNEYKYKNSIYYLKNI